MFHRDFVEALDGIRPGGEVIVLTWLDRARRDILRVHPRDDLSRPRQGVFSTRSADRPNPIGVHEVKVLATEGNRLHVRPLEAVSGTPIVDIKPVLDSGWREHGSESLDAHEGEGPPPDVPRP